MKILLATDGSKFSQLAVRKMCTLIDESQKYEIRVISTADTPAYAMDPMGVSAEYYAQLDADSRKRATEAVHQAEAEIKGLLPDLATACKFEVISGSPKKVIVEEAERWGADLIVVGSHGYGFWKRAVIGSVSDAVVNHAPCSVMVVRKAEE